MVTSPPGRVVNVHSHTERRWILERPLPSHHVLVPILVDDCGNGTTKLANQLLLGEVCLSRGVERLLLALGVLKLPECPPVCIHLAAGNGPSCDFGG